jgi:hypothetical protein
MKRLLVTICLVGVGMALALSSALMSGCEEAKGLQGLDVSPGYATLTPGSNVVEFVVSTTNLTDLAVPLEWEVTDRSLGRVISSSGMSGLYVGTGITGENTVIVRDQHDNEGYATVRQMAAQYRIKLTAQPEEIPPGADMCVVSVGAATSDGTVGGQAPFAWSVYDESLGSIVGGGDGATAFYKSKKVGVNVVQCRDANGVVGAVAVLQF